MSAWRMTAGVASWLSLELAATATVPDTLAPLLGAVTETLGAVRSTNQVYDWVEPVLPARSVARTWRVWLPSASGPRTRPVEQEPKLPPSSLHSKLADSSALNANDGLAVLLGSAGFAPNVVVGAAVSTLTMPPVATVSLPTLSERR